MGALLPALLALTISPMKAVVVVLLFVVLNQVEGYILQSMVMGREVKLHPAMVIVSFLMFGALLGIVGVLLAVPPRYSARPCWTNGFRMSLSKKSLASARRKGT